MGYIRTDTSVWWSHTVLWSTTHLRLIHVLTMPVAFLHCLKGGATEPINVTIHKHIVVNVASGVIQHKHCYINVYQADVWHSNIYNSRCDISDYQLLSGLLTENLSFIDKHWKHMHHDDLSKCCSLTQLNIFIVSRLLNAENTESGLQEKTRNTTMNRNRTEMEPTDCE